MTSLRKRLKRRRLPVCAYGYAVDCNNTPHPNAPKIENVRRIAGQAVVEGDFIKSLAANVMFRNMLLMGDI